MTYYLLLSGDSEKDTLYETNVLGEESFDTFYPSVGFMILNRIINQKPEFNKLFSEYQAQYPHLHIEQAANNFINTRAVQEYIKKANIVFP